MIENRPDNRAVNVVDCPMGCGKTSAAIHYINHAPDDERFVFATPYVKEDERISQECANNKVICVEKDKNDSKKITDLTKNILIGNSVACTHAILGLLGTDVLENIRKNNYTLIIDEAYEILRTVSDARKKQLFFLLDHNIVTVSPETGIVSFVSDSEARSCRCFGFEMVKLIQSGCVYLIDNKIFIWMFPVEILNAFRKIVVLTYMFDAYPMYYYLMINGYQMNNLGVKKHDDGSYQFCPREQSDNFRYDVSKLIHILDDKKLNSIGDKANSLSDNWYKKDKAAGGENLRKLGRNIRNVQRNKFSCSTNDFMWTSFKHDKYAEFLDDKNIYKKHVASNMRASNAYRDRHYLAYGVGLYTNPDCYNYFKSRGYTMNKDKWALALLVQWIWRSAIRDGEEIYLYIPSKYMRNLLINWLDGLKGGEENA